MKKVFALVVLAGSLSLFSCESNTTENTDVDNHDTTIMETPAPTTPDTTGNTGGTDTTGNTGGTGADTSMTK